MSDYVQIGSKAIEVKNRFNPGGIMATLERWQNDPSQRGRWVVFDGVSVSLRDRLAGMPDHWRSICLVEELGGVVGPDAHLTLHEFLYNDF
jgi:hypothetical protein